MNKPQLFVLGRILATPAALRMLDEVGRHPNEFLILHVTGDFGDISEAVRKSNLDAIAYGGRIASSYRVGRNVMEASWKLWLRTEGGNTFVFLPEEA